MRGGGLYEPCSNRYEYCYLQCPGPVRNDTPQHPGGVEREPVTVDSSNFRVCVQETIPRGAAAHPCDGFPLKKVWLVSIGRKTWKWLKALFDTLGRSQGNAFCRRTLSRLIWQPERTLLHSTIKCIWMQQQSKNYGNFIAFKFPRTNWSLLMLSHNEVWTLKTIFRLDSAAFGWSNDITSVVHEAIQYSSTSLEGRGSPRVCVLFDWTGWVMQPGIRWSSLAAANPPSHWSVWTHTIERLDQNHSWPTSFHWVKPFIR